jgi:mono/diheme cytochrome c family protein
LEDEAGPLWIVDGRNKMILRLDRGESFTPPADDPPPPPGPPPRPLTEAEILADADLAAGWSLLSAQVFRPRCATCHRVSLGAILEQTNWLDWSSMNASPLVLRLEGRGGRLMPPNRPLPDELIGRVRDWIGALDERARNEGSKHFESGTLE